MTSSGSDNTHLISATLFSIAGFLIGTATGAILTLFLTDWFVRLLPAPKMDFQFRQLTPEQTNDGCNAFVFSAASFSDAIPSWTIAIQPGLPIIDHLAGTPPVSKLSDTGLTHHYEISATAARHKDGRCRLVDTSVAKSVDLESSVAGHVLTVYASDIRPALRIWGAFTTEDSGEQVQPIIRHNFTYTRLGWQIPVNGFIPLCEMNVSGKKLLRFPCEAEEHQ